MFITDVRFLISYALELFFYFFRYYLFKLQMGFYPVAVYNNKTQHTNNKHHTNNTPHSNKHSTQNYTNNKGHTTHNDYNYNYK
jgi:hypothetical protein